MSRDIRNTIFHVHTYRCNHTSEEKEEEYIKKALELKADQIVFTDHGPFPENQFFFRMKIEELPEYISELERLKEKYREDICVQIGLEIEYLPQYHKYYAYLKDHMDLLLLGDHFGMLPDHTFSFHMKEKKKEHIVLAEGILYGMESGYFSAVSHPDRIFRRQNYNDYGR